MPERATSSGKMKM